MGGFTFQRSCCLAETLRQWTEAVVFALLSSLGSHSGGEQRNTDHPPRRPVFDYGRTSIATTTLPFRGVEISGRNWEFVKYITLGKRRNKTLKLRKPTAD